MRASPVVFCQSIFTGTSLIAILQRTREGLATMVRQRREDRQQTALFSNALFHNITIRINPK
jgi:transposase